MKNLIIGASLALLCSPAFSAEGRWTEGFGQGNLEYFIDKQGFRLYIGCPTGMEAQRSLHLFLCM